MQLFLMTGPILFVVIELLFFTTVIQAVSKIYNLNFDDTIMPIIRVVYPILIQAAMVFNANLYCVAIVYEREQKIRYLLNFQGIKCSAYIIASTLGDQIIAMIPAVILTAVGMILNVDGFIEYWWLILLTLICFDPPFIGLINILAQPYTKV